MASNEGKERQVSKGRQIPFQTKLTVRRDSTAIREWKKHSPNIKSLTTKNSVAQFKRMSICHIHLGEEEDIGSELLTSGLDDFEDKLFDVICEENDNVSISKFKRIVSATGLSQTDPRLRETMQNFDETENKRDETREVELRGLVDRKEFKECIADNIVLLSKALKNQLIIPEWRTFCSYIEQIYNKCAEIKKGQRSTAIPQLARANPDHWGVSICTVDGQRLSLGDATEPFCLQSVAKTFSYAIALNDLTPDTVHSYVGHEPSGRSFNDLTLNWEKKPHNPMINAGAIVIASLIKREMNIADRFDYFVNTMKKLSGGESVTFNNSVFLSEKSSADRNYALGYYLRENKCFLEPTNLQEILEFYFQMCSIEITCEAGAVMAATLANGGICPKTGEKVLNSVSVRNTLSLMHSCGMYDYSGQFAFKVGLPAKSGSAGGVMLIVPNVMGVFMWSPLLDKWGNSCKAVAFCQHLVQRFNFHNYDNLKHTPKKYDPRGRTTESKAQDVVNLLFSAFGGDVTAVRRYALLGMDMSLADYDGRTALHIAAAEGHLPIVRFLLEKCHVSPYCTDRWGFTPIDDAKRFGHDAVSAYLKDYFERNPKDDEGICEDEQEQETESETDCPSPRDIVNSD